MEKGSEPNEYIDEQKNIEIAAREYNTPLQDSYADYIEIEEVRHVGPQEREAMVRDRVEDTVSSYHHERSKRELEPNHVFWDSINREHIDNLRYVLEHANNEEDMQRFLTENSILLIQHLGGGHGRYVIPKPRLGSELVPDFLIAELSSIGLEWYGVELESPLVAYYTANGQARSLLVRAVQQVVDWRAWLQSNLAYARSPKSDRGLGLVGITNDLPATILIGRRTAEIPARFNDYRRQIKAKLSIEIHTYDWLVEQSESRVHLLDKSKD
jgi:hypothetical protein